MKELKLSDRSKKEIKDQISETANELLRLMDIASIDQLKVSLDICPALGKKAVGVKISALRSEHVEFSYDEEGQV